MMLLAALGSAQECSASSVLEDFTDTLARLGGTLEIVLGGNLVCYSHTLETQERKKRCETQLRAQGRGGERTGFVLCVVGVVRDVPLRG